MMPKLAKQVTCDLAEYIKTKGITFVNLQIIETNNSENYPVIRIKCKLSIRHENTFTLDNKGLVLLMAKINDEDFQLGRQGFALEFCIFCLA